MANQKKGSDHYALLTGLRQIEDGPEGRGFTLVACMKVLEAGAPDQAEVEGTFFVDSDRLPGGEATIVCRFCGERHELHSLLDAFGKRLLPTDIGGGVDLSIGVDALTMNAVRWLRTQPASNGRRKASQAA